MESLLAVYKFISYNLKFKYKPEYDFFQNPDRLSGRNDATSDKVNFRSDIRQSLIFEKNQDDKSLCGS